MIQALNIECQVGCHFEEDGLGSGTWGLLGVLQYRLLRRRRARLHTLSLQGFTMFHPLLSAMDLGCQVPLPHAEVQSVHTPS